MNTYRDLMREMIKGSSIFRQWPWLFMGFNSIYMINEIKDRAA